MLGAMSADTSPARWDHFTLQTAHRSIWRERFAVHAVAHTSADPVLDWLVDQANLRGFCGAVNAVARSELYPGLSIEEIVVGCLTPDAVADGRVLKLVVRILQSNDVDVPGLLLLARRERAERLLYWLVGGTPEEERTGALPRLCDHFEALPPRGYVPVRYAYDFGRLRKRAATAGHLRWKPAPT